MPKTYRTISGDMWDAIAYKTLGSELYMDALMAANPAHRYKYIFPANVILTIPEKREKPIEGLPPWKRGGVIYGPSQTG